METTKVVLLFLFTNALILLWTISDNIIDFIFGCVADVTPITNLETTSYLTKTRKWRFRNVFSFLAICCIAFVFFFLFLLFLPRTSCNSPVVDDTMLVNTTTALLTTQNVQRDVLLYTMLSSFIGEPHFFALLTLACYLASYSHA